MNHHWRTMYSKPGEKGSKEMFLASNDKQIKCYKCGKPGHKAHKCKNRLKSRFTGKYNSCEGTGHKAKECFKDPKDGKIPDWYKKRAEKRQTRVRQIWQVKQKRTRWYLHHVK